MQLTQFTSKLNGVSAKNKAIAAVMALAVLPVIVTGVTAYFISANNLEQSEIDRKIETTKAFNINLTRFIALRAKDVETLSNLSLFSDPKVFAATSLAEKEDFLTNFLTRYRFYSSIMVFDLQGNPVAASAGTQKTNHADRNYFQAALKTQKTYVSPPQLSKSTGKMVFHFAAPIFDPAGKLIGIVRASMPIESLNVVAKAFDSESSILKWHIINRQENLLVLTNDTEEGKEKDLTKLLGDSYAKYKESEKPVVTKDREKGNSNLNLVAYQALPAIDGLGKLPITLYISQDMNVLYAKSNQILTVLGVGILLAGGLTIGLSLLLSTRIAKYIENVASNIISSAGNIVSTVEMQEYTVNNQANSAIETTGTINQLGSISYQAAEQAEASATGARQALNLAEAGTQSVRQTLQGMNALRQKVDAIANQIVDLSAQTGQIATVSELVADLANQTNMLALNAAVEAARAGEQGKGFSVVASEIRKLADQSRQSADRINTLAEDIQSAINRTVMVTDEGTKEVQQGIDLAQSTAQTFVGVSDAINNVFLNSQQISTNARQQSQAVQQVLAAMTAITQGSQESAVGMHQVKVNTQELNFIADELKAAVV